MHHILRPAWYAFLSTRQSASAFNQSLSLDTSSVTDMQGMFHVRSPACCSRAAAAPCPPAPRPTPHPASYALPSDLSVNELLVRCKQTVDPLRLGRQTGIRSCLRYELGFGCMLAAAAAAEPFAIAAAAAAAEPFAVVAAATAADVAATLSTALTTSTALSTTAVAATILAAAAARADNFTIFADCHTE